MYVYNKVFIQYTKKSGNSIIRQIILLKKVCDGKQVHEKMFNNINH